jgi:hypothetical protein
MMTREISESKVSSGISPNVVCDVLLLLLLSAGTPRGLYMISMNLRYYPIVGMLPQQYPIRFIRLLSSSFQYREVGEVDLALAYQRPHLAGCLQALSMSLLK